MPIDLNTLVEDVGVFMQDDTQFNLLRNGREFSPGQIRVAVRMMVADFNLANYISSFVLADLPDNLYSMAIYGTIYHLMNSAAILQTRNHLPYNDSGLSVGEWAKSGEYQALANQFKGMFDQSAVNYKWSYNMSQGFGGVLTEYSQTSGWASIYGHSLDN